MTRLIAKKRRLDLTEPWFGRPVVFAVMHGQERAMALGQILEGASSEDSDCRRCTRLATTSNTSAQRWA
jgi:hypothetical protein